MNTENELQAPAEAAVRRVAVIIPYYQRSPGILARALTSAMEQELPPGTALRVIVIDDESPAPVEPELAELTQEQRQTIVVLRQPNGGPGAARNTGLDHVNEEGADFVAFLDSDDVWLPTHISDALRLLDQGKDFYFCDHNHYSRAESYFEEVNSLQEWKANPPAGSNVLNSSPLALSLDGTTVLQSMVKEYLSQTSTVMVRQELLSTLRFDPSLRNAGEDYMLWVMLLRLNPRVVISWAENVSCGEGVNIYFSAFDWSSEKSIDRVGYILVFYLKLKKLVGSDPDQAASVDQLIRSHEREYGYMLLRGVLRGLRPSLSLLRKVISMNPRFVFRIPGDFIIARLSPANRTFQR